MSFDAFSEKLENLVDGLFSASPRGEEAAGRCVCGEEQRGGAGGAAAENLERFLQCLSSRDFVTRYEEEGRSDVERAAARGDLIEFLLFLRKECDGGGGEGGKFCVGGGLGI